MHTARATALRIRADYGLSDTRAPSWDELVRLANDLGLAVEVDVPFAGRIRELTTFGAPRSSPYRGAIGIAAGQTRVWQRWLLCHGVGHGLLHAPANHFYLATLDQLWLTKQERQADCFAGTLLFGALDEPIVGAEDLLGLAWWASVPVVCVRRWLDLIGFERSPIVAIGREDVDVRQLLAG